MNSGGIAYLLAEFPSHTETFIRKEAIYINRSFPLFIFALKNGTGETESSLPTTVEERLQYIPPWTSRAMLRYFPVFELFSLRTGIKEYLRRIKVLWISRYIAGQIRQLPVRHIHAHFANAPAEIAMQISRLSGISFSFTAHAHDIYAGSPGLAERIKAASFVATCTSYNKKWLTRLVPERNDKIYLIYHGVDLDRWPYHPLLPTVKQPVIETIRLLSVGRLIEKKGFLYLLEAVRQLRESGYLIRLSLVGEGNERAKLKDYCRRHSLEVSVDFIGWQTPEQIKVWHACSDMFVLPSIVTGNGDRDGIPNVLLEAMATGLPVISSSVSGIPEVIRNHHNGLLVPEKDSLQLARAISYLIDHPGMRARFAENARHTVEEKFSHEQCNTRLKDLFESIAGHV
jgi:glycosyltransferase involved in cell wall biosynthesis